MPILDVPGVYIDEVTSPGVIGGVGTSTAAFIGPALAGPINLPTRVSSFDEFLAKFGAPNPDGSINPYITTPRAMFLAHGVRAFYDNGGKQAYIVRVGTAKSAMFDIKNGKLPAAETAFSLRAKQEGLAGNNLTVAVQSATATGAAGAAVAVASATVSAINGVRVTVNNASPFRVGDIVTRGVAPEVFTNRAEIKSIDGVTNTIELSNVLASLVVTENIRIASILPAQVKFRLASATGIFSGTIAKLKGDDADAPGTAVEETVLVQTIDAGGFVTLAPAPARAKKYNLAAATPPVIVSLEFRLIITPTGGSAETFDNLSLSPTHPNYLFAALTTSQLVTVVPPLAPPTAPIPQNLIPAVANVVQAQAGVDDNPGTVGATEFQNGINMLKDIEDVNILVVPDAGGHADAISIQLAMINHCLLTRDRFAVLDSRLAAPPSGPGSIAEHRQSVQADRGFAALYYPWLVVRDPTSSGPTARTMLVPPSGAIAGIYARTDGERGVHKAPANTDVRGVLGLERILSDGQQGPLNLMGVNALRIFPGTAQVVVWGARTTGDPQIHDFVYVNVRRLLIYLEQSIESGIRWAVFEPNGLPLWQKLKRTITEFLTRTWRDGALFGATAEKAFYVRIDEALNPPSTRALGRLYIEIGLVPVFPAEFIIVRIGLWDGGASISEG
jgi:hypothetical protein